MHRNILLLALISVMTFAPAFAHGDEHKTNSNTSNSSASTNANTSGAANAAEPGSNAAAEHEPVTEFPNLHPLIVHFPIVILIVAAVIQIAGLFVFGREFGWLVVILTAIGAITAYLSSSVFHPHTTGLSESAARLLTEHEFYADITLWTAIAAAVMKSASQIFLDRKWWSEAATTIVLLGSAAAVAWTGHHGGELVHKEGVGPKGAFLESHDH